MNTQGAMKPPTCLFNFIFLLEFLGGEIGQAIQLKYRRFDTQGSLNYTDLRL